MLTLVGRSLGRVAPLFAGLLGLLVAFQLALVAVAASYGAEPTFARMAELAPTFIREGFGLGLTSFSGMTTIGYFHPVVIMVVVQFAIYLATEPAGEIEWSLIDLLMARPLPRHRLVTRSLLVMTIGCVALSLTLGAGMWIGLLLLAPHGARWPETRVVSNLIGHLAAVAWCFGGAALAAAAWARRRGSAQAPVAIAAVALYLVYLLGAAWRPARVVARLSPFLYYQGAAILAGRDNTVRDLSILFTAGVVGTAIGYWQFSRRDL
jgi:hypothetical protein